MLKLLLIVSSLCKVTLKSLSLCEFQNIIFYIKLLKLQTLEVFRNHQKPHKDVYAPSANYNTSQHKHDLHSIHFNQL